jgi:RimJ/RimL family protein N-acetyltransferase
MIPLIEAGELPLLKGRHVYLQFLAESHREILRPLARNERIWEYTKTLLLTETYDQQFNNYFHEALAFATKGAQTFAIVSVADDRVIGMTRAYDLDRRVKKVTIGHTWYIPSVWGLAYNKECKLLLLTYMFEGLGSNAWTSRWRARISDRKRRWRRSAAYAKGH